VRLAVICAILAACTGCIYDGTYRYPCQDPDNWEMEECRPPICEADGTCTTYLVPEGVLNETEG
jgi:hypothetical protein